VNNALLKMNLIYSVLFLFFYSTELFPSPIEGSSEESVAIIHQQLNSQQTVSASKLNLEGANLEGFNLNKADFSGANLKNAKLGKVKARKANFKNADLSGADFTDAIVDGAVFKGAKLLGIKYEGCSAKGSLLTDLISLSRQLQHETKRDELLQSANAINLKGNQTFEELHATIHEALQVASTQNQEAIRIDFSKITSFHYRKEDEPQPISNALLKDLIKEFLDFLKTPYFNKGIVEVVPFYENHTILVRLINSQNLFQSHRFKKPPSQRPMLDLHGKVPLSIKQGKIDSFIKSSYASKFAEVEIITGRGLHNPHGKMGILWKWCKNILLSEQYKIFIESIETINKNGGWNITLKPD